MILQALCEYYDRKAGGEDALAPIGFEPKEISFVIVLDHLGQFIDLEDTRQGEGKKKTGRVFMVPKGKKRPGKNSWQTAFLLWDHVGYVLGHTDSENPVDRQRAAKQRISFIQRIKDSFSKLDDVDEDITAVLTFLERGDFQQVFNHASWNELRSSNANLSFRLSNRTELVCQCKAARLAAIDTYGDEAETQYCLTSGTEDVIERLHPPIKGVWGAQSSGADIISFNWPASCSHGKKQGLNAPIGRQAAFAYTTALNHLLRRGSRQRMQIGDASTVFWAERAHPFEDEFLDFIEADPDDPDRHVQAVRALYASPQTGRGDVSEDPTRFYVLGLAPNAARIAVRFWHFSTVADLARNIRRHFDDLAIEHEPNDPEFPSLSRLLESIAAQGKRDNIPPNLAGDVIKAILAGTPYPWTLLTAAIRRIRAEQRVTHVLAALIKAVLVRRNRHHTREVNVSLDPANTNIGYRLGRLFATLERAQESASPGINTTIRDRFYGAASATPVTVFPQLMKLKNHHLAKLEHRGQAVKLEKLIGEIIDEITDFPAHLDMADQGRFAVGYYHQRQAFYRKSGIPQGEQP